MPTAASQCRGVFSLWSLYSVYYIVSTVPIVPTVSTVPVSAVYFQCHKNMSFISSWLKAGKSTFCVYYARGSCLFGGLKSNKSCTWTNYMYAIVPKGHCTNAIESQNTSSSRNHVKVKSTAATGSDLLEVKVEGELYLGYFLEAPWPPTCNSCGTSCAHLTLACDQAVQFQVFQSRWQFSCSG